LINQKRYMTIVILLLVAVVLQYSFLQRIHLYGAGLELLLFFPVFGGLLEGPLMGCFLGFAAGLLQDIFIGKYIGLTIISFMAAGTLVGWASIRVYKENYLVPIAAMALGLIISQLIYYFFMMMLGASIVAFPAFLKYLGASILLNGLVAPFFYVLTYKSFTEGWLKKKSRQELE